MGYEYAPPTYKLSFEDHPGLEVTARAVELGDYLDFVAILEQDGLSKENVQTIFEKFASFLTSWNLERGGQPVPLKVESLYRLDIKFVREIIDGWREGMEGGDGPLEQSSDAGSQSVAASIPMEDPSVSRVS